MKTLPALQVESLSGRLHKIIFRNNENGYLIGLMMTKKGSVSIVGYMMEPREGEEYEVKGKWTVHQKYGNQFQFESYEIKAPTTLHGIEEYLASGLIKGVGPAIAERIVKHFGIKTLDILNEDPGRLKEVSGIGQKKAILIQSSLVQWKEMQGVLTFLKSYNIGTAAAIKIYKAYGNGAINVVQNNPYQLIRDVDGIGFKIADDIARAIGVERESIYRIEAGIHFVLDEACRSAGHCFLPLEELVPRSAQLLEIGESKIPPALITAAEKQMIVTEGDICFPAFLFKAEEYSSTKIEKFLRKGDKPFDSKKLLSSLTHIERRHDITFDEKQRDAVLHAILKPVTILTGGPGTGKTLCTNGIIELADELGVKYLLCAPTGRAAKRLSELTKKEAKTIHRLLEYDPNAGFFKRNEDAPLKCDMVIVDEMSMVDIQLFAALLAALEPSSQLVLVGDVDQLPSVGPGQVLRDLINSKLFDTVRLNTIFRQSEQSSIIANSHRINEGEPPEFTDDFRFIDEQDVHQNQSKIVKLCATILPQNYRYDPFDDIQVLTPMHNSAAGVRELNKELQQALNGHSKLCWQGSDRKFLMGDKVMQIKNNYDKDVYNGDIGRISGADREDGLLFVTFDGKRVDYKFDHLDELVLAYAMTIHKSQGNEFKAVIMPMITSHYIMLQRNLLYTAVTRARERLIIVGEKKALAIAIRNADVRLRNTKLMQRLLKKIG